MGSSRRRAARHTAAEIGGSKNGIGLAAAINQAGQAVVITNADGTIVYVNAAFTRITGYTSEEAIGQSPRLLRSGLQDPAYYKDLWNTITAGRNWRGELINRRKDGSTYTEEMTISPVRDSRGRIVRYIALKQDITHRRESEKAQQFLASIVTSREDAITRTSLDGKITFWNEGAESLYGYRADEVIGKPVSILFPPNRLDEPNLVNEAVNAGQNVSHRESVRLKKNGQPIDVSVTVVPVRNGSGEIEGHAAIAHDISERIRAFQAMRTSAKQFRTMFEHSPDCLLVHSLRGRLLDVNPAGLKLLGYERQDIDWINSNSPVLNGTDKRRAIRELRAFRGSGLPTEVTEYRLNRKDGTFVDVEIRSTVIPWENETHVILGIARDITERKRSENALRESEERFRTMADSCPTMIWVTDAEGGIRFANRTCLTFFGLPFEKGEGHQWITLLHPDDVSEYVGAFRVAVLNRTPFQSEARVRHADGEWRWIVSYAEPRWSPTGEFLGHVGISPDITERKRMEGALRDSEEKFRQLAENVHEVFWMMNAAGTEMLYVSPAYEQIWGLSCADLHQNPMAWMEAIEPEDKPRAHAAFLAQLGGEAIASEYRIRTPEGALRWVRDKASPVRNESGEIVRVVGIADDITEAKKVETAIREAKEAAEAANRAKSQFLANMSHEIRTPLNGIIGMSDLLLDSELSDEQRHCADVVHVCGESLLRVINDILDFSKIEAGKLDLEQKDFDLRATLSDAVRLLSDGAAQKGLKMSCRIDPQVPARLRGDPGRLSQVVLNLLGNAVKFTASGKIAIGAKLDASDGTDVWIRVSVEDTGIGIPENLQRDIFSPFTQADGSTTRRYGGTGLGLTICKQLVELMGGQIGVESEPGKGSKFWFTIGLAKPAAKAQAAARELASQAAPVANRSARILMAEDNLTNQQVGVAILKRLGHAADVVGNGEEALARLRANDYDLVLMDCQMPVLNGYETARCIRDIQNGALKPDIPIIALTAHAMAGDRQKCLSAGMNDYIVKPIEPAQLGAMIGKWLGPPDQAPDAGSAQVFDLSALTMRMMGDRDLVRVVLSTFIDDMPKQLASLKSHLAGGDVAAVERTAHAICGAAATVSGTALQRVAGEMEHAGSAGDLQAMLTRLPELEQECRLLCDSIRRYQPDGSR